MSLILQGEVITIINRTKKDDGSIYARLYQVQTVVNNDGYKKSVDVDDFDLSRKVEVGKEISIPVYAAIWQPEDKKGKKGLPVIQYHALKGNNVVAGDPARKGVKV